MIQMPDTDTLVPQCFPLVDGQRMFVFKSSTTELLRIDLLHEAGSAYQQHKLCAATTNRMYTMATASLSSTQVAEFMDYRGIIVQNESDIFQCTTSFYLLRRHLDDLLPLLKSFLDEPGFTDDDFKIYLRRRKQEMLAAQMRTSDVAQRLFYSTLLGDNHPMGRYAQPEDADALALDAVKRFFADRYGRMDVVLSGNVDNVVFEKVALLSGAEKYQQRLPDLEVPELHRTGLVCRKVHGAAQTTVRVGRIIPLKWNEPDYARFVLLTTLLGGYFGSRLMENLREEHGYTYGVYARTRICRGVIVFFITSDVASDAAEAAENEIKNELQRLCDKPVDDDELELVKKVLVGDFIRSVDGVFERAERFCDMMATGVDEVFTDNLRQAVKETTAAQLHTLAQRLLSPETMLYCRVTP